MAKELKAFVLNLKSLDQQIPSPILVGAGDANGRALRIIFTQEAADAFTPLTKVYLKWYHQDKCIKGYNVFQEIKKEENFKAPQMWEIKFPRSMLYEGDVTCTIEIVDKYSVSVSLPFIVHVTTDPYDSSQFEETDDFTVFQQSVIYLTALADEMEDRVDRFDKMEEDFNFIKDESEKVLEKAEEVVYEFSDRLNEKLDADKAGIDFDEETPTIKAYIDRQIVTPHLEIVEFIGEDE